MSRLQTILNEKLFSIIVPALVGLAGAALSVKEFEQYGWSLFVGLPILVSFLSSFCYSYKRKVTFRSAYGVAFISIMLLGGLIMLFALDGLICLLMALPLTAALALIGVGIGRLVGSAFGGASGSTLALLFCFTFPALVSFEHSTQPRPVIRKVTTSVLIDAPIQDVWDAVIAFPKITDAPEGIFKLGIAYPIEATIEGQGVGAIRYCTFSTGSFVEPITTWDAPHLLAFDVTENPPPMNELSLYDDLHAPHLHGHMVSKKGQFVLMQQGDKVLLEGTTWYTHSISPEFYWGLVSDEIIHKIHLRVLNHIKQHSESH